MYSETSPFGSAQNRYINVYAYKRLHREGQRHLVNLSLEAAILSHSTDNAGTCRITWDPVTGSLRNRFTVQRPGQTLCWKHQFQHHFPCADTKALSTSGFKEMLFPSQTHLEAENCSTTAAVTLQAVPHRCPLYLPARPLATWALPPSQKSSAALF